MHPQVAAVSKSLLILGAGGHGKVVADTAAQLRHWRTIAFIDAPRRGEHVLGFDVLDVDDVSTTLRDRFTDAVVAIGDPQRRLQLLDHLDELGFSLPSVCHPRATISPHAAIGAGSVVFAGVVINAGTVIGRGCIVNTSASVDHDCVLEDGVHIAPGAHLAGGVHVGHGSWIGIGACVRENLRIGSAVTVGAGGMVVADVDDGLEVAGVPATAAFRRP